MHRILVALALTAVCFAWDASSAHALSCRNRLVTVGDPMVRVQDLCGEPASVSERVVHRTQQVARYISPGVVVSDTVTVSVTQTIWVYDFGPTQFMRELVFEGGRLAAIDTLSYGTPRGRAASLDDAMRSLPIGLRRETA
jgi:hypothetical protein